MKSIFIIFLLLLPLTSMAANQGHFTIKHVGYSVNSNHIIVVVNEAIEQTSCQQSKIFRAPADSKESHGELLSLFIAAKATASKMTIGYNESQCVAGASTINYVYLL